MAIVTPGGAMPLLALRGIVPASAASTLRAGIDLHVGRGELLGLVGSPRAGRLALFDVLSGLAAPRTGVIELDGRQRPKLTSREALLLGIARTLPTAALPGWLTVRDYVTLPRHDGLRFSLLRALRPVGPADVLSDEVIQAVIEFVGIEDVAHYPLMHLSPLHRALADLARALVREPRLLLLQHFFTAVPPEERPRLVGLIEAIRDEGVAVVVLDDDLGLMCKLCPRLVVLDDHRVIADGSPEAIGADIAVLRAFAGEIHK